MQWLKNARIFKLTNLMNLYSALRRRFSEISGQISHYICLAERFITRVRLGLIFIFTPKFKLQFEVYLVYLPTYFCCDIPMIMRVGAPR